MTDSPIRNEIDAADEDEVFAPLCNSRMSTVLLIEDDEDLNDSLALRLEASNLRVVTALDGKCGMEKFHEVEPDIVVLDLGLPRLHGSKLLHWARMEPALTDIPIIVITGSDDPDLEAKMESFGVARILFKPVSQRRVVRTIREILEHD